MLSKTKQKHNKSTNFYTSCVLNFVYFALLEIGPHFVAQVVLELMAVLLGQAPKCWDCKYEPLYSAPIVLCRVYISVLSSIKSEEGLPLRHNFSIVIKISCGKRHWPTNSSYRESFCDTLTYNLQLLTHRLFIMALFVRANDWKQCK